MTNVSNSPHPPSDFPDGLVDLLRDLSDDQLRDVIEYAQALLRARGPSPAHIEPREGEEIVHTHDFGGYTLVIVRETLHKEISSPAIAYRVNYEPAIKEGEGGWKWHYLGDVYE